MQHECNTDDFGASKKVPEIAPGTMKVFHFVAVFVE